MKGREKAWMRMVVIEKVVGTVTTIHIEEKMYLFPFHRWPQEMDRLPASGREGTNLTSSPPIQSSFYFLHLQTRIINLFLLFKRMHVEVKEGNKKRKIKDDRRRMVFGSLFLMLA